MSFLIIISLVVFSFLLLCYSFWQLIFLRNPAVHIPTGNTIVSPAFGTISKIMHFNEQKIKLAKGLFGQIAVLTDDVAKEGSLIVIRLTPLDVHYQRSPVEGTVLSVKYTKGTFSNAVFSDFVIHNEKNEVLIKHGSEKVKVIQIAGFLARRIHCFFEEKQQVKKGELLGLINLGSQVVLFLEAEMFC